MRHQGHLAWSSVNVIAGSSWAKPESGSTTWLHNGTAWTLLASWRPIPYTPHIPLLAPQKTIISSMGPYHSQLSLPSFRWKAGPAAHRVIGMWSPWNPINHQTNKQWDPINHQTNKQCGCTHRWGVMDQECVSLQRHFYSCHSVYWSWSRNLWARLLLFCFFCSRITEMIERKWTTSEKVGGHCSTLSLRLTQSTSPGWYWVIPVLLSLQVCLSLPRLLRWIGQLFIKHKWSFCEKGPYLLLSPKRTHFFLFMGP